nr:protein kinase [Desulfatitalea tepidiphila]
MQCGREPGGAKSGELGICPAAVDHSFDGINAGTCAGRICWAVSGTFCDGRVQGSFAEKRASCLDCDFYRSVHAQKQTTPHNTRFLHFIDRKGHSPFFDRMTRRRVAAGERFVDQGAIEDTAYIIQSGACLVIVEKEGELHPVDHYGPGDIVGGLGILTGEPRRAHVEAETEMDLWVMTRAQFDAFTEKDPDLLDFITELVADRFDSRRPTAYRTIGKYVTTDIIGRGAFSIVYKGFHSVLNTPVVIKMMRHDMALHPEFFESFYNEAKTIASLEHDHIVKVYDFDERYRTLFIIMEQVKGEMLKTLISRLGTLPPGLAARFIRQIGAALAYAHQRGIVHRDINPANIIVEPNDRIKILDFGLACPTGTEDFTGLGTAAFMAPEQIEGGPLDGRTDIYALGITAFEMLTGQRPFPEDDPKRLLKLHLTRDITDPKILDPHIPEPLRRFILTAGRRDPDQRYGNMDQAMAELQPLIADYPAPGHTTVLDQRNDHVSLMLTLAGKQGINLEAVADALRAEAHRLGATLSFNDCIEP